jgi:hypothetical protein
VERDSSDAWVDLAANAPGRGVRAEAAAATRAHPFLTALGLLLGVQTKATAWAKGGRGEVLVGKQLATLGPEWRVLHAIPVGSKGTDIDHLVLGPGGVFSLNTKNHQGQRVWVHTDVVKVNGQSRNYLRVSEHEAQKASRLLSAACGFGVSVTGVVVILADALVVKREPTRARVVPRREIAGWLRRQPALLDTRAVEAIFSVARRSTTWM